MALRQSQFRIDEVTDSEIQAMKTYLANQGLSSNQSDVIRFCIRYAFNSLGLKPTQRTPKQAPAKPKKPPRK